MVEQLWKVSITAIYVDGSFIEEKDHPNDIDGYFKCELSDLASGTLTQDLNKLVLILLVQGIRQAAQLLQTPQRESCLCGAPIE